MKKRQTLAFLFSLVLIGLSSSGLAQSGSESASAVPAEVTEAEAKEKGCLSCHDGIEDIREQSSPMMIQVKALGASAGDPGGCVTCHGGTPTATTAEAAHQGAPETLKPKTFYPDPGSVWIAEDTCGQCHQNYAYRLERSLMNTEAGKIQGNLHTWGLEEVQNHKVPWGNYAVEDTDGSVPQLGTDEYKEYMAAMMAAFTRNSSRPNWSRFHSRVSKK